MTLLVVVLFLALSGLLAWTMFAFNRLVRLRNQVRTAWADVDVQLSRQDLVPSLVTAVQAYAGYEQAVLAAVTELRGQAMAAQAPGPRPVGSSPSSQIASSSSTPGSSSGGGGGGGGR